MTLLLPEAKLKFLAKKPRRDVRLPYGGVENERTIKIRATVVPNGTVKSTR